MMLDEIAVLKRFAMIEERLQALEEKVKEPELRLTVQQELDKRKAESQGMKWHPNWANYPVQKIAGHLPFVLCDEYSVEQGIRKRCAFIRLHDGPCNYIILDDE